MELPRKGYGYAGKSKAIENHSFGNSNATVLHHGLPTFKLLAL